MSGFKNKISAIVKGPSWVPGSPWTGHHDDKIDVRGREKYDVKIPFWCNTYALIHFIFIVMGYHFLAAHYMVKRMFNCLNSKSDL